MSAERAEKALKLLDNLRSVANAHINLIRRHLKRIEEATQAFETYLNDYVEELEKTLFQLSDLEEKLYRIQKEKRS